MVTWLKSKLAKRLVELFGQQRKDERLVLLICTGSTGKDHPSNVVVCAEPLGSTDAKEKSS